ncbi:MAG: hypothetical protein LBS72_08005 [Oscillospiraceae bacterium]|jgi:hypothetical protein|nr:hypothetical protein [Oscillospiraceae bacterium]
MQSESAYAIGKVGAMVRTKITKKRVQNHFAYSFWKYMLWALVSIFGWNLIYSVTAYRPPADKKVDVYLVSYSMADGAEDQLAALAQPEFQDMEELNFMHIALTDENDYYANLQMSTYIGAQEGDVYLMPASRFRTYAQGGLFIPLEEALADGTIDPSGVDIDKARMTLVDDETGEVIGEGIFGIPAASLYGLMDLGIDNRELWIGVTAYSKNAPNAMKMIGWLINTYQADKPEWLVEQESAQPSVPLGEDALPSY